MKIIIFINGNVFIIFFYYRLTIGSWILWYSAKKYSSKNRISCNLGPKLTFKCQVNLLDGTQNQEISRGFEEGPNMKNQIFERIKVTVVKKYMTYQHLLLITMMKMMKNRKLETFYISKGHALKGLYFTDFL